MTAKEAYTYTLVEINKLEAPSLLLEDFNYLFNKAVQQYINKSYNRYEMNQQATDDLRALKKTVELEVFQTNWSDVLDESGYYCELPDDYMHILNCIIRFSRNDNKATNTRKCGTSYLLGDEDLIPARKLTSDIYPSILTNAYLKPSVRNPYYFINNIGKSVNNQVQSELERLLNPCSEETDSYELKNKLELRFGQENYYTPNKVYIDYLKTPEKIKLTYDQIHYIEDTSQVLEFSDYVCYEIINEVTKLVLENIGDPRLQTNIPVNQTIGIIPTKN